MSTRRFAASRAGDHGRAARATGILSLVAWPAEGTARKAAGENRQSMKFRDSDLLAWLLRADSKAMDSLEFGVIGLDRRLVCTDYNRCEEQCAGLSRARVIGLPFFEQVAPCMNNYLVSDRLRESKPLDLIVPYTLSVRVTPTPVTLRLLVSGETERRFLLIDWPRS